MHLSGIGVGKFADFQVDHHQTPQPPVKEQQVNSVPLAADSQPSLSAYETEVSAEFQEESLQAADQCFFQIAFGIFVFEIKKFENEGVLDRFFGQHKIFRPWLSAPCEHGRFILGQGGALVELGVDLTVELTNRPPSAQSFRFVKLAGV